MSKLYWSALAGALLLSVTPAAAGLISFVSAKGVNTGDCSSPASPCQTLGFALSKTAASGEIKIIDPGNYVSVIIDKSITITGVDGASINRGSAGNAMTINAGATGVVTIRNLTFDGIKQGGTNGILLNSASSLTIKNCLFQNFSFGILLEPTSALKFFIEDTVVRGNSNAGIRVDGFSNKGLMGALNRVSSINNSDGLVVREASRVTASDSVFSSNSGTGVEAVGLNIVLITRSTVTGNGIGVDNDFLRVLHTAGDNAIAGNDRDIVGNLFDVGTK